MVKQISKEDRKQLIIKQEPKNLKEEISESSKEERNNKQRYIVRDCVFEGASMCVTLLSMDHVRQLTERETLLLYHNFSIYPKLKSLELDSTIDFYKEYPDFDMGFYKKKYNIEGTDNEIIEDFWNKQQYERKDKRIYNDRIKIVLYIPTLSTGGCGGLEAMLRLAQKINQGDTSKIYAKIYNATAGIKKNNPFCNDFASPHEINDRTIVIYPEVIKGNPLGAKNVIRWVLLDLGIEMPSNYYLNWRQKDLIYFWEPKTGQPQLAIPFISENIKNTNKDIPRRDTCYIVRKGRLHENRRSRILDSDKNYSNGLKVLHDSQSLSIDSGVLIENLPIEEIFNGCEIFYCYDPNCFYAIMAPICGCITVLYPHDKYYSSKEDFIKQRIYTKNGYVHFAGIAYGDSKEEIDNAFRTLPQAKESLNKLISLYEVDFTNFMSDIFEYMNNGAVLQTVGDCYMSGKLIGNMPPNQKEIMI